MSWSFTSGVLKSILHEQRISLDKVKELDIVKRSSQVYYQDIMVKTSSTADLEL